MVSNRLFLLVTKYTGCTKQGQGMRDNIDQFKKKGFQVFGISADSPKAQLTFKTKQNFPYSLLSDPDFKLLGPLGAQRPGEKKVIRSHWIIDKSGVLRDIQIQVSPAVSVERALAWVEAAP